MLASTGPLPPGELLALVNRPYGQRRQSLESLELAGPYWVTTPVYRDGDALVRACEAVGAEGAVAKRTVPGIMSQWLPGPSHGAMSPPSSPPG